jgi:3-phenylpropionate/trans-cinnamate dioxygenase ferredoxin reductase subunit
VQLSTGESLPADIVIVGIGIGIVPNIDPLVEAGAAHANGVSVDAQCRTSLPDVFAIGDCALHHNHFAPGAAIRLESVQNAADQAAVVGRLLAGQPAAYDATPWFWSNQYDVRLQTVGLSQGYDSLAVRGASRDGRFSVIYFRHGQVIALDCVNNAKDFVQGRRLVEQGVRCAAADVTDSDVSLKTLLAAA